MKKADYIGRRGELIAEMFLQDLGPLNLLHVTDGSPFDYIAGFQARPGRPVMIAIVVKATELPIQGHCPIYANKATLEAWTHSNLPVLIVVVDVKANEIFYNWASTVDLISDPSIKGHGFIEVPVRKVTHSTKVQLLEEIQSIGEQSSSHAIRK